MCGKDIAASRTSGGATDAFDESVGAGAGPLRTIAFAESHRQDVPSYARGRLRGSCRRRSTRRAVPAGRHSYRGARSRPRAVPQASGRRSCGDTIGRLLVLRARASAAAARRRRPASWRTQYAKLLFELDQRHPIVPADVVVPSSSCVLGVREVERGGVLRSRSRERVLQDPGGHRAGSGSLFDLWIRSRWMRRIAEQAGGVRQPTAGNSMPRTAPGVRAATAARRGRHVVEVRSPTTARS